MANRRRLTPRLPPWSYSSNLLLGRRDDVSDAKDES